MTAVVFDEEGSYEFDVTNGYTSMYAFEDCVFSNDLNVKELTFPLKYYGESNDKPFMNLRNCKDYYMPYTLSSEMLREDYYPDALWYMLGAGFC